MLLLSAAAPQQVPAKPQSPPNPKQQQPAPTNLPDFLMLEAEALRLEALRAQRAQKKLDAAKLEAETRAKQKAQEQAHQIAAAERILARFPPELGWGPDRKAEIDRRRLVLGLFPDEEER